MDVHGEQGLMEPDCAICGSGVDPADRHVEVGAEYVPREEWANADEYVLHVRCWRAVTDGWRDPA